MTNTDSPQTPAEQAHGLDVMPYPILAVRGAFGGVLMGLANLVPGISGGTMLLAAGVYHGFVNSIAEFTTLKFRTRSLVLMGAIVAGGMLAILFGAGGMKDLVVHRRWAMYSVFIGLTFGGAPLVWRLAQPVSPKFYAGAAGGFAVMVLMAFTKVSGVGGDYSPVMLFIAGLVGASAMVLPGVSGGYLLLLLGQYLPILGAIHTFKLGLLGDSATGQAANFALVLEALQVVIPVGIGVVAGVVGVSNLVRWLLDRYATVTLGVLFGLLFGAIVGLWPFQQPVRPDVGDVIRGETVTAATIDDVDPDHWPTTYFTPTIPQVSMALGLILAGLAATAVVDRLGTGRVGGAATDV